MIITPKQLWQDFDPLELEFAQTIVREEELTLHTEQYIYFNGVKTLDGVIRVCAKFYKPKIDSGAAIVVFDDIFNSIDAFDPSSYLSAGFSVLVVDYAGENNDNMRYTIYPSSLNYCNYHKNNDILNMGGNPHETCWYIWGIIAMRATAYLENLKFKYRFALGFGHGGEQVWKACFIENAILAGATVFGGGLFNSEDLAYKTALDSSSYAISANAPVFIQVTSNELNNSLDEMSELYQTASVSGARFSILERSMHCIDYNRVNNPLLWFLLFLQREFVDNDKLQENLCECPPSILIHVSEQKLYCNVIVPDFTTLESIELFVAYGTNSPSTRYWRNVELKMVSESEYLAVLDSPNTELPLYIYATAKYKSGLYLSSTVLNATPKLLGIEASKQNFKRLLYDTDLGISNWTIPNNNESHFALSIKEGPLGLTGLTSNANRISTYMLADDEFKAGENLSLQCMIYSKTLQEVTFIILCSKTFKRFVYEKSFEKSESWEKLSLSLENFKLEGNSLKDWNNVLTFSIYSKEELLLSSMLWV